MEGKKKTQGRSNVSSTFKIGAIALAFLAIGFQSALFVRQAAEERSAANRDNPDTVFVTSPELLAEFTASQCQETDLRQPRNTAAPKAKSGGNVVIARKNSSHSEPVERMRARTRTVESFRFNPNTVSVEDLVRLGFTEKQALAIDNYRAKGGKFRRKSDFEKSFVVTDSVFERLEKFIDIPLVDINLADSAEFDALPGIGGWFAAKMVSYRDELGGYSFKEQLMDIYHFDREKYDGLSDLICVGQVRDSFALWTLPVEELRKHPYIRSYQTARSIVFYRDHNDRSAWTVQGLSDAGILPAETADKLSRCVIATY